MEKIIDYFISENTDKNADYIVKERLMVLFLLFSMLLSVMMIPTYVYLEAQVLLKLLFLLLAGSLSILLYLKFSKNLRITSFLFISFCILFLFLNIIFTGAISSVLVIWLILLPILAILLDNGLIAYSIIGCTIVLISLVGFEYYGIEFPNEMERNGGIYLDFFSRINFMFSIILIIFLYNNKRNLDKTLLEKSNKDLEQFAYVASHDMKAPLRNMMSFTQLLRRKIKGKIDADTEKYIQLILSNGYQMNELIQGILDISKIEKQETLALKTIDLNAVATRVKINMEKELEAKNALLIFEPLPTIVANEPQIIQVFQNLIENSIKYNRNEQPIINISYQQDKKFVNLFFSDNGIGIDPQYYDKIFEMFKRLHSGFEFKGTGIGLAICRKIALRHKGDLTVEKSSDEGTVFKLSLPVK
jgi:signal transduction histidine kinase